MNLTGNNDRIEIRCTGPYVLYMNACYKSLRDHETRGYLQLQVSGQTIPESSITLTATQDDVCTGLLRTVYLRANEQASLYLYVTDGFKVKTLSVGLSYLLGSQCDFWWGLAKTLKVGRRWKPQHCLSVAVAAAHRAEGPSGFIVSREYWSSHYRTTFEVNSSTTNLKNSRKTTTS